MSNSYIANMNYQWQSFKDNHKLIGTSGDAYIDAYFKKSVGIAGFTPTFWIHQTSYFEDICNCWKASGIEFSQGPERSAHSIDEWLGWNKVPWDNFALDDHDNDAGRMFFMAPLPNKVWMMGIPSGYIYRIRD